MTYRFTFITFLLGVLCLGSCKKMPNDGVPFYMAMDSVVFSITNPSQQGNSNTHKITDAWVEANTDNLGAYELPCNFPVLQENTVRFVVSPGIWFDGQEASRDIYPFYETDTFSITATRGFPYKHIMRTKYKSAAQFAFVDEENPFSNSQPDFNNMSANYGVFPWGGTVCGKVTAVPPDSNVLALQNRTFVLNAGEEIWLELDYKSDIPFWVGVFGYYNGGSPVENPVIFLTAKSSWNKIYIKLSETVANLRADQYKIYFEALRPSGTAGGSVYVDNIKLVHALI